LAKWNNQESLSRKNYRKTRDFRELEQFRKIAPAFGFFCLSKNEKTYKSLWRKRQAEAEITP
jgi:hypothetical protein